MSEMHIARTIEIMMLLRVSTHFIDRMTAPVKKRTPLNDIRRQFDCFSDSDYASRLEAEDDPVPMIHEDIEIDS